MAKEEGYTFLPQPAQLGCADSALSPAALLPMAAAGIEPLALLEGAEQAYHDYDLRAFENPAWMYAGARHALELRARRTEFLGVFEPALLPFARWLAGNTARRSCRGGYGVLPVPAELPGRLDAMDAMLAGSRSAFETFLRVPLPARKRKIELDWKDYDGLGYLSGHAVDEADGAMFDALVQTHASLDVPLIVLSAQHAGRAAAWRTVLFLRADGGAVRRDGRAFALRPEIFLAHPRADGRAAAEKRGMSRSAADHLQSFHK